MPDVDAYIAAGAAPPGGLPGPPVAPLDNGGLRSQITAELRPGNKAKRVKRQRDKRRYHATSLGGQGISSRTNGYKP